MRVWRKNLCLITAIIFKTLILKSHTEVLLTLRYWPISCFYFAELQNNYKKIHSKFRSDRINNHNSNHHAIPQLQF